MGNVERSSFINFVAANPDAGELIQGTGGARKVRWARPGAGRSGGYRVVYYYHDQNIPLFLLAIFAKNERVNLSKAEQIELKAILSGLAEDYRKHSRAQAKERKHVKGR